MPGLTLPRAAKLLLLVVVVVVVVVVVLLLLPGLTLPHVAKPAAARKQRIVRVKHLAAYDQA